MQVLSYGYKLPETGDFGDVWFVALEDNITRLNGHTHDGSDSSKLPSSAITPNKSTVVSGSFSLVSGEFRALVSVPAGMAYDDLVVICKDPATGEQVYLSVAKVSATTFYLYTSIQQDYEVYFLT